MIIPIVIPKKAARELVIKIALANIKRETEKNIFHLIFFSTNKKDKAIKNNIDRYIPKVIGLPIVALGARVCEKIGFGIL
jgi:hypothetical protein